MKLKKVASLCFQAQRFSLWDRQTEDYTEQWLGDGNAAYPIEGLPYMDMDNICAMFDISEKKREKLVMRECPAPESLNWTDTDPSEREIRDPKLNVRWEGLEILPLRTSKGIVFIQEKYLAPLDNLEYMRLYERRTGDGGIYIVAKIGMVVQAIILPVNVVTEEFIECMEELTELCRDALEEKRLRDRRKQMEKQDRDQGTLFQVDENTGEIIADEQGE